MQSSAFRPVWSEIDLAAVRHNVAALCGLVQPAQLLAVVKADAYGHGAVPVARAALEAGAAWLGVALVEEGVALRDAGIAAPLLVLSEPSPAAAGEVVARGLTPVVYTHHGIEALAKAVADAGRGAPLPVHLKVDTGMHRVGCQVDEALPFVELITQVPELSLEGVCTHFAVADEAEHPYTARQRELFDGLLARLDARGLRPPLVHAANSAAAIAEAALRYDLVRIGIALYGIPPSAAPADRLELRPALALKAKVSFVKELGAGERLSYGLRYELPQASRIATVPVGYADGVPRNLGAVGGEVLIGGRRHPIAGTITMDQLMVDVGDATVEVGDEVVLLGAQGADEVTASEWAARLGTIPYEIVCQIGPRVPRRYR
ncbi:MAG: alanine racemase [Acidimicrobiia bacterium]